MPNQRNDPPIPEKNNFKQGRTGAATPKKEGPAVGKARDGDTNNGGINRPTRSYAVTE